MITPSDRTPRDPIPIDAGRGGDWIKEVKVGDEVTVTIPDRHGNPQRFRARIEERLDERSPGERGEAS